MGANSKGRFEIDALDSDKSSASKARANDKAQALRHT